MASEDFPGGLSGSTEYERPEKPTGPLHKQVKEMEGPLARLVESLSEDELADLDRTVFNHSMLSGLPAIEWIEDPAATDSIFAKMKEFLTMKESTPEEKSKRRNFHKEIANEIYRSSKYK